MAFIRVISLCLLWMFLLSANAYAYEYPIKNPLAATIVGTPPEFEADLPKVKFAQRELTVFNDRKIPEVFWYSPKFKYGFMKQHKKNAPLAFVIAGTGSDYMSEKNYALARMFYALGFHVVSLSSPTHPNFIITASTDMIAGNAWADSNDLYSLMRKIRFKLSDEINPSDYYLTGYSLGAYESAFISYLDNQEKSFNFKKVILVNPPANVYKSVTRIDALLNKNLKGDIGEVDKFFRDIFDIIASEYKRHDKITFNDEFVYSMYRHSAQELTDEKMQVLIGMAFRLSMVEMAFTSDVMTKYGYLVSPEKNITKFEPLYKYLKVGASLDFNSYAREFLFPYYNKQNPMPFDRFVKYISLPQISGYLRQANNIYLMHNEDDLIIDNADKKFFKRTFGKRAKFFTAGGHCGNVEYKENVEYFMNVIKSGEAN